MHCPVVRYFIGWKGRLEKSSLEQRGTRQFQIVSETEMNEHEPYFLPQLHFSQELKSQKRKSNWPSLGYMPALDFILRLIKIPVEVASKDSFRCRSERAGTWFYHLSHKMISGPLYTLLRTSSALVYMDIILEIKTNTIFNIY